MHLSLLFIHSEPNLLTHHSDFLILKHLNLLQIYEAFLLLVSQASYPFLPLKWKKSKFYCSAKYSEQGVHHKDLLWKVYEKPQLLESNSKGAYTCELLKKVHHLLQFSLFSLISREYSYDEKSHCLWERRLVRRKRLRYCYVYSWKSLKFKEAGITRRERNMKLWLTMVKYSNRGNR